MPPVDCRNQRGKIVLNPSSVALEYFEWPRVPTGRAFCAFPLLLVRSLCFRPLPIPRNQLQSDQQEHRPSHQVYAHRRREVPNEDIVRGSKVDTDTYVEVTKEELENVALESTRTIDIDEFVQREEIDPRYIIRPYYLRPDGKVGHDAFAVIRETIRDMNTVAIGRVVLTSREHIIALEPLDKGLMGTLLRYPYEVRDEKEYFDEIQDVKVTREMLDLAKHVVNQKAGQFEPEKFEDQYEAALVDLISRSAPANRSRRGIARSPATLSI
jgi:DNA end-binding protein Ku